MLRSCSRTNGSNERDVVREQASPPGDGRFIAEAVTDSLHEDRRSTLPERLIAGYQGDAERDRALAEEWRHAEEMVWREPMDPREQGT